MSKRRCRLNSQHINGKFWLNASLCYASVHIAVFSPYTVSFGFFTFFTICIFSLVYNSPTYALRWSEYPKRTIEVVSRVYSVHCTLCSQNKFRLKGATFFSSQIIRFLFLCFADHKNLVFFKIVMWHHFPMAYQIKSKIIWFTWYSSPSVCTVYRPKSNSTTRWLMFSLQSMDSKQICSPEFDSVLPPQITQG